MLCTRVQDRRKIKRFLLIGCPLFGALSIVLIGFVASHFLSGRPHTGERPQLAAVRALIQTEVEFPVDKTPVEAPSDVSMERVPRASVRRSPHPGSTRLGDGSGSGPAPRSYMEKRLASSRTLRRRADSARSPTATGHSCTTSTRTERTLRFSTSKAPRSCARTGDSGRRRQRDAHSSGERHGP